MKIFGAVLICAALMLGGCSPTTTTSKAHVLSSPQRPVYFHMDPSTAGTITGEVAFRGKRVLRTKVDMDEDPECEALHKTPFYGDSETVNRNGTLANVFVYVKNGLKDKVFAPPSTSVTIDQRGCWFIPRVLGIQVGQVLRVTNSDPVTHNIHPRPHDMLNGITANRLLRRQSREGLRSRK